MTKRKQELLAAFTDLLDRCKRFEVDVTRDALNGPTDHGFVTKVPSPDVDMRITFRGVREGAAKRHNPRRRRSRKA
jgi:hypothetical protein